MTDGQVQTPQPNIELQQLDWHEAQALAKPIRQTVFIEEQGVPEAEEWGHGDEVSLHIIAKFNGKAVGTARLTVDGKIGRMAVLKPHRRLGIASIMLAELIKTAKQQGQQQLKLNAQTHAQGFYGKHGFIAHGNEFMDAGIPHVEMTLPLDPY